MSTVKYAAKEGQKFSGDTSLEVVQCPTCFITYAIPESLASSMRAYPGGTSGGWWVTCPLGHSWSWDVEGIEKQLRDRLARERASHDQTQASLKAQRAAAKRARNERDRLKAHATAGVCPVDGCHRHFTNLERHIETKHPDFKGDQS